MPAEAECHVEPQFDRQRPERTVGGVRERIVRERAGEFVATTSMPEAVRTKYRQVCGEARYSRHGSEPVAPATTIVNTVAATSAG